MHWFLRARATWRKPVLMRTSSTVERVTKNSGDWRLMAVLSAGLMLAGCIGVPPGIAPVEKVQLDRYLGKWYEIARLDHSFERGLDNVTAEYSLREDGGIRVMNSGYLIKGGERKSAEGRAYFVAGKPTGHLKVSFFGPFYGSYVIFELDQANYEYAFVTGYNKSYLWLLSRRPVVDSVLFDRFVAIANSYGFNTANLIRVNQVRSSK